MMTTQNEKISSRMASNYINALVNKFYKILPIKETNEDTLKPYLESLLREMLGLGELMAFFHDDDRYLTLLCIVRYFIDHEADIGTVRTEVFRAIGILKKLQKKYCTNEG